MRRLRFAAVLLGLAAVAGCGALEPYPTVPISARPGSPAGQRVAICYNTLTTSLPEIQRQAQQECPAGTSAEPDDTDYHLQNCPLLLPGRGSFVCTPRK